MSRNPILTDKAFEQAAGGASPADEWRNAQAMGAGPTTAVPGGPAPAVGGAAGGAAAGDAALRAGGGMPPMAATTGARMTMGGVAAATLVMFGVLLVTAFFGWQSVDVQRVATETQPAIVSFGNPLLLFGGVIAALVLAIVTSFKPKLSPFTSLGYAACEGYVLGAISAYFGALYSGIVAQAILATFGVFLVMLVLYGLRVLRATPKFVKGVIAATFGIMFMYLGVFILNIFGVAEGFWTSGSPLGIAISVVVVIVAALNLILDFDFIERGTQMGLPRYMDWYAGFGLLVTLVWLYLEMLRLLARLRQ